MSDYFPEEILVEILHRLPTKSIVKCTSVCKLWRSLITNNTFISDHLHRPIYQSNQFLLIQSFDENEYSDPSRASVSYSLRYDDDGLNEFSTLNLPRVFKHEPSVAGICNGLVCINSCENCDTLILCNPCIRRYVVLPKPSDYCCFYFSHLGFGFDSRKNDYKVVRISCMMDDESYGLCPPDVEIYSLATGFWKNINAVAPVFTTSYITTDATHACINGIVHWSAKRMVKDGWYNFIVSFDFVAEVFSEIMLPESLAYAFEDSIAVIGGGNSLTVYQVTRSPSPYSCNIWVMKEYGVVESWNKLFTFNLKGFYLEAPSLGITLIGVPFTPTAIYIRKRGEILLMIVEAGKPCLYSLDIEGRTFKNLGIGREGYTWHTFADYYAESLVLLDKASGLVSY